MQSELSMVAPVRELDEAGLVELVRKGDRNAGAEFFHRNRDLLRRRIRRRLRPSDRRLFDSQDILSSACRRLDRMVRGGTVRAVDPAALMALIQRIALNSVIDKGLVMQRLAREVGRDSRFAAELRSRIEAEDSRVHDGGSVLITRVFNGLSDPPEREILTLWLRGLPLKSIAAEFETRPATMRKRWEVIRRRCVAILATGGHL